MHPVLLRIGPVTVYTYGVFVASGFLAALAFTMREARRKGLRPEVIPDLGLAVLLGAVLGSRLLYVLINLGHFIENPLEILMIWKGGLVFSGGAVLGGLLGYLTMRRLKQPILPWLDTVAPGLALGQAIGRIGCFFAGCCYGQPSDLPWAVTFRDPESLAPLFAPLHPTQLYHSLAEALTFGVLLVARRRITGEGRLMGLFLVLWGASRVVVELFRGDARGEVGPYSLTQVLALAFFALGLYLLVRKPKRS